MSDTQKKLYSWIGGMSLRIPDLVFQNMLQNTDLQNLLSRLVAGEIFEGRVIAVDGNFLLMQLLDGSKITAQVDSGVKYNPGDLIKLKVIERQQGRLTAAEVEHYPVNNGEITAEGAEPAVRVEISVYQHEVTEKAKLATNVPVKDLKEIKETEVRTQTNITGANVSDEKANEKAGKPAEFLKSVNMPVNRLTVEIFKAIVDMGSEPDTGIIEKAINLVKNTPVNEPRHAVFLILNEMEDNEHFREIIKELDQGEFRFSEELENLIKILEKSGDEKLSEFGERIKSVIENSLVKAQPFRERAAQKPGLSAERKFAETAEVTEKVALPKAEQLFKELKKEFSLLSKFIPNSTANDREKIISVVNRLETAILFFNEVRGFEMFVQVPFIMRDNRVNGELYIMKRTGKKGKINSRDFTMFLSMSTDNIGQVDIFVHVRNKNIMMKIFTGNEKLQPLFMDEYKSLYNALKEKGYNLFDMGFQAADGKVSIFNAAGKASELLDIINKSKIDIKV